MVVEQATKNFKDIQNEYDQLFKEEPIKDEDRAYQWFAKRFLKAQPNMQNLIDVACGGGYFFRQFRKVQSRDVSLVGIDISPQAIEIAKGECPDAEYLLSVGESLPFQDGTFDAMSCLGSLEHFLDLKDAIGEMCRVMKPDGTIFILVPNIFWYKDFLSVLFKGERKTRNQTHERFASWGEWISVLEEFGLKVERTEKYNGIAKYGWKQWLKDLLIPIRFSYHFLFICKVKH